MMNRFFVLVGLSCLFSCTSYDVTPGAERVRIFDAEPKGCLYVGEVSSIQKGKTVGTLETLMDLSTRVDLRNKAHELGGNVLVFLKGKNTNTLPGSEFTSKKGVGPNYSTVEPVKKAAPPVAPLNAEEPTEEELERKDKIIFLATVFKCPTSILNQ